MKKEKFAKELDYIVDADIKKFAETAVINLPDYFFTVAASSTGKYHPQYALGDGGLVRHTKAVMRFANYLLSLEHNQNAFSADERDCIIVACLLHDGWKHGDKGGSYTTHEHPLVASEWVRTSELLNGIIPQEQRNLIADGISSHMGQWNTAKRGSKVILPKPETEIQKFIHMCDYLASRKDIEVLFEDSDKAAVPDITTFIMPFGKHKGKTLLEINQEAPDYIAWMRTQNMQFPVPELLKSIEKELVAG